jgi:hypothetical protein
VALTSSHVHCVLCYLQQELLKAVDKSESEAVPKVCNSSTAITTDVYTYTYIHTTCTLVD